MSSPRRKCRGQKCRPSAQARYPVGTAASGFQSGFQPDIGFADGANGQNHRRTAAENAQKQEAK